MNIFRQLKKCPLFLNFDDTEINTLFDHLDARIVKYSRGQLVAKENTEINELCILLDGNLIEYTVKPNGEREVIRSLIDGDFFALENGYRTPDFLGHCIVSALDCSVLYITLSSIYSQNDALTQKLIYNIIVAMSGEIAELKNRIDYIVLKSMRTKIAKLIYDNYLREQKLEFNLGFNRNEMAKKLSVSRPSMSREMANMKDEGIIDYKMDMIKILDLDRIKDAIENGR